MSEGQRGGEERAKGKGEGRTEQRAKGQGRIR